MTVNCTTVDVLLPALITATSIVPDKTTCTEPCDVSIDVTWANNGEVAGTFTPSLTIDGNPITSVPYPSETLAAGVSVTHTFAISGLTKGSHTICPYPDTGTSCVTIIVLTSANIVTAAITPSVSTCTTPCALTVDVTWTNNGQVAGTFTPTITVNGIPMSLTTPETLNPAQSVTRTFTVPGLAAGTYSICSVPNTFPCATVTVLTPALITATSIVPDKTTCIEPCDLTIDVTWINTGGVAGIFTPAIVVDEISMPLAIPETLNPAQSVTKTFTVTGLAKGSHTICASPDTGVACATITVEQVVVAGFGAAGMVLIAGLVVGAIYASTRKKKEEMK